MKQQVCALLCAALLAMGAGALAQTATMFSLTKDSAIRSGKMKPC